MAFLPILALAATAVGAAGSATAKAQADKYNAQVDTNEANAARAQSVTQEDLLRNRNREIQGRQISAFGAAGVGYGGSSAGALKESAINQEMDALNTRYRGNLTAYGFETQAGLDNQDANNQIAAGAINTVGALAGSKALSFSSSPSGATYAGSGVMSTYQGTPASTNNLA